ncbi:hypothetical protein K466DRAFT_58620 [Polyporus arcularius HHB13444]|uniref:Uncharacterized protein n=1 Tax=Polyporus arcularius HHB13444 TaxID=1314778 RepID=A0A5C3PHI3_9APHY|nr:hypothetical protein K466DRAFT_58620 [Polyporus arcularius HHB13444]
MDLIDLYQDATRRVLAALPVPVPVPVPTALASKSQRTSTSTLPGPLKSLSFTYEPGYGTRGELRGVVSWPAPAAGSLQQLQLQPEEEWPAAPPEARTWTYARCASDALAALLAAGFEDVLCERDGLRAAFGGLELLTLRLWDPYCVDDPWYDRQVQRGVPTLYALREVELRMDVRREPCRSFGDHTRSLWDPEDSALSPLKLGRRGSQTDSDA